MSSYTFSKKMFKPVPPEKGSFPLDHEGLCKQLMVRYIRCLQEGENNNTICRDVAKEYLGCRMDNSLMAQEDWSNLGFKNDDEQTT